MTIRLPAELERLHWLVGFAPPEADEDALWRCARAWRAAAGELRLLTGDAATMADRVGAALGPGQLLAAFDEAWLPIAGPEGVLPRLADACDELGAACDHAATEVEYAKLAFIAALVALAVTLAALTAALVAGGVSALGMPVAVAGAQLTIRLILTRLVIAVALGAGVNVALDAVVQAVQLIEGHRSSWDLDHTTRAAEDGALYGAITGGVFLAGARFAPGALSTAPGLGGALATTGLLGGAVPLLHGEPLSATGYASAVLAGILGGVGPDLVHHRPHATPGLELDLGLTSSAAFTADMTNHPHLTGGLDVDPGRASSIAELGDRPQATLGLGSDSSLLAPGSGSALDLVHGHTPSTVDPPDPQSALSAPATPVTDQEALRLVQRTVFGTDAGIGFYRPGDGDRLFAEAVHPSEGLVTIDLHGTRQGFRIESGLLTPEQLALAIRELERTGYLELAPGTGIKLLSCDTGYGGSASPAARLARALGVDVVAPDQPVWTTLDGTEIVSSPRLVEGMLLPTLPPDGAWHRFDPTGKEVTDP